MSDQNLDTLIRPHVGRREYAAAQDLCLQWGAHVPDSPDALRMSGEIALLVGDVAGAIAFYREGDVLLPSWLTKISLAYAHLLRREYAEADGNRLLLRRWTRCSRTAASAWYSFMSPGARTPS